MEKQDARRLHPAAQEEKRIQVVRLRKKGLPNGEIAKIVGLTPSTTSKIWRKYEEGGSASLKQGVRGRREGMKRTLNAEQEKEIQRLIVDKTPDQMKFPFALWTREAVRQLIKQQYKLNIPLRTITDYLKRWNFSCQKPAKRAYEQKSAAVQQWLKEEYPAIVKQAKQEGAEIYWGDETGIQNDAYQAKGFSPKGKTPIIRLNVNKSRINMISAISNRGTARFMLYTDTMTSERLIEFMKRLIKDAKRKVYLILDNLRVHHSKLVKEWLEINRGSIQVYYLPSYSPELNPDEYLNGDLKRSVHSGTPARTEADLRRKTRSFMHRIQHRPHHVKKYFSNEYVAYAA